MFRRLARHILTLSLAGSVALTALSAAHVAMNPTLAPLRDATVAEITATVGRELARLSPDTIPARIATGLAAEPRDWVTLAALRDLATDLGHPLPPDLSARYDAALASDSGFYASAANCAACATDPAACTLSNVLLCRAPIELSPIGDVLAIADGARDYLSGADVDRLSVALAIVGLGATVTVVATGGTSVAAKLGASTLKLARGMGRLSPALTTLVTRAATDGVDWVALRAARSTDDIAATLRPAAFAPLVDTAADLDRLREATDTATALHLLKFVDTPADARRLANAATALGPRITAVAEALGKSRLLRATVRVTNTALALTAGIVALMLSLALTLSGWLQSRLFRTLRRAAQDPEP